MPRMFHVSSAANRASIREHGLDWTRMQAARGIAGSRRPEADGIFLCADEHEAQYFVRLNNTGTAVDVWQVEGIDERALLPNGSGYFFLPARIPPERVSLLRTAPPVDDRPDRLAR